MERIIRTDERRAAVFGSLACDYADDGGWTVVERPRRAEGKTARRSFAPGAVIGFVFAAALLVASLLGRMELTRVDDELSARATEIRALEEEQTRLQVAYGGVVDLSAVEQYATAELGMRRPESGQITYVETVRPDRVTVLHRDGVGALGEKLAACADILAECFS